MLITSSVHRANHSASPLTYSTILAGYSSSLIQSCASLSGSSVPSTNSSYSTNTYAFYSSNNKDESNASEQTARAISTVSDFELPIRGQLRSEVELDFVDEYYSCFSSFEKSSSRFKTMFSRTDLKIP